MFDPHSVWTAFGILGAVVLILGAIAWWCASRTNPLDCVVPHQPCLHGWDDWDDCPVCGH